MISRCLACRGPFPGRGELKHLSVAGGAARDPGRGGLWLVRGGEADGPAGAGP